MVFFLRFQLVVALFCCVVSAINTPRASGISDGVVSGVLKPEFYEILSTPVVTHDEYGILTVRRLYSIVVLLNTSCSLKEDTVVVWSRNMLPGRTTYTGTKNVMLTLRRGETTAQIIEKIAQTLGFVAGNLKLVFAAEEQAERVDLDCFAKVENSCKWISIK